MKIHKSDTVTVVITFTAQFEGFRSDTFQSAKNLKKKINQFADLFRLDHHKDTSSGIHRDDLHPLGDYEYNFAYSLSASYSLGTATVLNQAAIVFTAMNRAIFQDLSSDYYITN